MMTELKEKEYFEKKPPFINRKKEKQYLLEYLYSAPTNIMFIYGPKSTGKTTLILKILKELDQNKYDINYINLRDVLITQFKDFRNLFFPSNLKETAKSTLSNTSFGMFGFTWSPQEDFELIKENTFLIMKNKLERLAKDGKKPVIILDEFQYLKNIFVDEREDKPLIEELFKFFISITKQYNLAHVICLTSDSYYLDELYFDTKLKNTSNFYFIDHLAKEDIYYWLEELEKCPKKMVDDVWKNLGGSVWEIWQVFVEYKNSGDYKTRMNNLVNTEFSRIREYYVNNYMFANGKNAEEKTFLKVCKKIVENKSYIFGKEDIGVKRLIKDLVDKDLWFYDTLTFSITANSETVRQGIKKFLRDF